MQARTPYLDDRLVEAVVPLPARAKLRGGGLLQRSVAGALPDALRGHRPGAPPPLADWLAGPFRHPLEDLLRPPTARIRTFFDPRGIDRVLAESLRPDGDPRLVWALFQLEAWSRGPGGR